jgi:hypothetical protein
MFRLVIKTFPAEQAIPFQPWQSHFAVPAQFLRPEVLELLGMVELKMVCVFFLVQKRTLRVFWALKPGTMG